MKNLLYKLKPHLFEHRCYRAFDCSANPGDNEVGCDPAPVGKMGRDLYLISKEAWDLAQFTYTTDGLYIKTINLLPSDQAYKIRNLPSKIVTTAEGETSDSGLTVYNQTVICYLLPGSDERSDAHAYANNEWVIIAEQKFGGSLNNDKFIVLGRTQGLVATPTRNSDEIDNLITLTFAPREGSLETKPEIGFTTDETIDSYQADKTALEALLNPSS